MPTGTTTSTRRWGVRINVAESIVLSVGVFHPLNDQGVGAVGWSPLASVEGTF